MTPPIFTMITAAAISISTAYAISDGIATARHDAETALRCGYDYAAQMEYNR